MAVPEGAKIALVKIDEKWSNFTIKQEYKQVWIYGFDGKTRSMWNNELEKVLLTGFDHYDDEMYAEEITGEAYDDEGQKYLLIKRVDF